MSLRKNVWRLRPAAIAATALGLALATSSVRAQDFVVDQACNDYTHVLDYGILAHQPIGQEFVPTFDHVDIVELATSSASGTELQVLIREGSMDGAILGATSKLVATGYYNVERFEFAESVPLAPFGRYVIEVRQLSGTGGLSVRAEDNYPAGRLIVSGEPWGSWDTWFREGVRGQVPVHAPTWGGIKGLYR